ncbi:MAG: NPCBM/NEW2 domain-containing protein, partial [Planctomycetes bacterium]|nr:NPCBM/NEW2 domain-containing protein [Planctomycetota bacterium]
LLDVKWSDDKDFLPPHGYAYVPLDHKYKLDSGLMEITYDSGAKVILEGPCTYEVESTAGGYLSLGKLTARVEKRGEGRGARGEGSESNPQSPIPNPLFAIRTPTAVVTDLGTEFGVEVSGEGATESRVFRGSVRVQVVGDGLPSPSGRGAGGEGGGQVVVLRENESARVEGGDEPRVTVFGPSAKTADFTRRIPKVTYKTLDLVDVVAGGDGFSGRRDRGIDPTNGQAGAMTQKDMGSEAWFRGDGQYHRVEALPFVDGVFVPDGRSGPVRVDSAGNMFAGFPDTFNATWKHIWAGGMIPVDPPSSAFLGGIDYASPPHCLLFMHANNGITFDLEAIRRANPSCKLLRFRAVAGNSSEAMHSPNGERVSADLWVLVDGQVRFERREIAGYSGEFRVLISIGDDDRFLTLASTDGGTSHVYGDWIVFGDPRLDLMQVDANEPKNKRGGD